MIRRLFTVLFSCLFIFFKGTATSQADCNAVFSYTQLEDSFTLEFSDSSESPLGFTEKGTYMQKLNTENLYPGLYIIKLSADDFRITTNFTVSR